MNAIFSKLAEACANRTHQRQDHYRSAGFEVQAAHQDRSASAPLSPIEYIIQINLCQIKHL